MTRFIPRALLLGVAIGAAPAARAQWAVIDVHAIAQLAQQVQTLAQQLATARSQLLTATQQYQSLIGTRGMERLLSGTVRNYLPEDWNQLVGSLQAGSGAYAGLAADFQAALNANSVLSTQGLAALSASDRARLLALRQQVSMDQVLARQALANTSSRFASIQALIDAIPAAGDAKSILDLEARISAEQGMLQNEQTKLQVLGQSSLAEASAARQREIEDAVAGQGQFETRFRPVP